LNYAIRIATELGFVAVDRERLTGQHLCPAAGLKIGPIAARSSMRNARRTITIGAAATVAVLSFAGGIYFAANYGSAPKLAGGIAKAAGIAQKDVDQSTSDQQTAEGNFKAASDAVRIFGKTDAEIDQVVANAQGRFHLLVPSPITGRITCAQAAPGLLTQPGNAPAPYSVADVSTMWMLANVIETDIAAYKLGQEVEVRRGPIPTPGLQGDITVVGVDHRSEQPSAAGPLGNRRSPASAAPGNVRELRHSHRRSRALACGAARERVVREGDGTMTVWVTTDSRHFTKRTGQDRPAAGWLGPDPRGPSAR
jgi:hypothetical protein